MVMPDRMMLGEVIAKVFAAGAAPVDDELALAESV